jgi:hypothetical protein
MGNFVFVLFKKKRQRNLSIHIYFFPPKGIAVTSLFKVFFFFEKTRISHPNVKILCPGRQISIYIVAKKYERAILSSIIFLIANIFHEKR